MNPKDKRYTSASHKWKFKASFRREAYAWHGSALAAKRLSEAVREIKKVAKDNAIEAAEGAVSLMERLWPSLQNIDTSSGALGNAVFGTLEELIPILIAAQQDRLTREKWLSRLYKAILDDGVDYLAPVAGSWGKICQFPEIINEWADLLLPELKESWKNDKPFVYFVGTTICLSCLLEAGRYEELEAILDLQKHRFWHYDEYWAEALKRQGRANEALEFAESRFKADAINSGTMIMRFCENLLLELGRKDEAYSKYGRHLGSGMTYISQYRSVVKKYPERDRRPILLDLIEGTGDKASWFASARQAGYLDIALDCAYSGIVNPQTLIHAARDTVETAPEFAFKIALRAAHLLLIGYGYEPTIGDMHDAFRYLISAAQILDIVPEALSEIEKLLGSSETGRNKILRQELINLLTQARKGKT